MQTHHRLPFLSLEECRQIRPAVGESIAALQRWEDDLFLVAQICSLDDQTSSFKLTCMAAWWWIIRAFVFDRLVHIYQSLKFDAVCAVLCRQEDEMAAISEEFQEALALYRK